MTEPSISQGLIDFLERQLDGWRPQPDLHEDKHLWYIAGQQALLQQLRDMRGRQQRNSAKNVLKPDAESAHLKDT